MSSVQSLILVVDDDADLRQMVTDFLTGEGFRVATAADGGAGFEQAVRLRPAAILLDYAMPLMDGWLCAEKLGRDPITSRIPNHRVHLARRSDEPEPGYACRRRSLRSQTVRPRRSVG